MIPDQATISLDPKTIWRRYIFTYEVSRLRPLTRIGSSQLAGLVLYPEPTEEVRHVPIGCRSSVATNIGPVELADVAIPRSDTSYPEPTGIKFGTNEIRRDQTYLTLNQESRPKELHLRPLAERCVSLSTHTAPIRQTRRQYFDASVRTVCAACWQWTQSFGQPVFSAHYSAYTSALPTLSA